MIAADFRLEEMFGLKGIILTLHDTLDGSELRHSPVEVGSLSHYLQGFLHPNGGWPWDF